MISILMASALLVRKDNTTEDEKYSIPELMAHNLRDPENTNGQAISMPVTSIVGAPVDDPARWLIAVGNCPCRPDGMGNNISKFVNAVKAAIRWLFDTSDVPINSVVIDFSIA